MRKTLSKSVSAWGVALMQRYVQASQSGRGRSGRCVGAFSWMSVQTQAFRLMVWGNVVLQLLFPLMLTFTPTVVAARQADLSSNMSALQAVLGDDASTQGAVGSSLPASESAKTSSTSTSTSASASSTPYSPPLLFKVATPEVSDATVGGGAVGLSAGATLPDLGSTAAMKAQGNGASNETDALRLEREKQQKLDESSAAAQRLWGVLGGPSKRDQGLDMATGIASGMANQAAQEWLNQFGNARISFSTQGIGSADILLPLMDTPDALVFTQPGLRRSDDRTTGNIGLGARYFMTDWMLGVNTFYDNDFTGNNRRLGVGFEAWRDYLKLSANSYFRLSDWHQSPLSAMRDYDERPANGYDVRAEAYLPSYPQLGGKLAYEHYQGKNVSLDGGTSDLRDNPSAVTVGVSYTPVPLIKLGLDHTTGSGINNTNFTLDFSYRLGVPFVDQISPESVDFSRTLAGSRYDLVDRNYDIVLQYRKQDLISLLLTAAGKPYSGESVVVTANVTTKYGLDHIVWDAPSLIAAGGAITPLSASTAKVTMPVVNVSPLSRAALPSYVVGAVAFDKNGNQSNHATLTLTPERAPQDIGSVSIEPNNAAANGVTQNTVTVTAVDNLAGQPLANAVVNLTFTYTSGPNKGKTLPALEVTTDGSGKATATVGSKMAGDILVTATLKSNGNSANATMSFVADNATAGFHGTPGVNGDNAVADGKSTVTVTFPVTDANGNPVKNQTVTITTNNGASPASKTVTTDENGNATVTVTNTTTGTTTVTATTPNGNSQSQDVNFIPGNPDASKSSFTVTPETITANGGQASVLTLTLRDANNNPIEMNSGVSFAVSGLSGVTLGSVALRNGTYTSSLAGVTAGVATVTPVVKGVSLTTLAKTVTLTADGSTAQIASGNLTVLTNNAAADDSKTNSVQAIVTDAHGNPVSGVHVTFSTVSPAHITVSSGVTDARGMATAALASSAAGSTPVTATINGSSQTVNVNFKADTATATLVSGSVKVLNNNAVANNTATNSVSVKVVDANGNPVAQAEVDFTATNGARINSAGQTDASGVLIQSLTSAKAGNSVVTATVNGVSQSVTVTFVADTKTAQFDGVPTVTGNNAPANGSDKIGVDFTVTDANGNPLANQTVTIKTNNGAQPDTLTVTTDSNGVAHVDVTNTTAGNTTVTAGVNGQEQTVTVTFVADSTTATLSAANLTVVTNNALANGVATNSVKARVTDAGGNSVPNVTVNFVASNGAHIAASGVTGADGTITRTLTNTTAGSSTVTVTVNGTSQTTNVLFKADSATATLTTGSLVVVTTGAVANGMAQNSVKATVTDRYGNIVSGATVSFTATNGASIAATGATDADGTVTQTLTSIKAGSSTVTATVNGVSLTAVVAFIADGSTAGLDPAKNPGSQLITTLDRQVANGVAADTVKATVTDKNGNPVAGLAVLFSVTTGATVTTTQGTTDNSGVATASVTSTTAGSYTVTAAVNGSSKTTSATLIADSATAKFTGTPVITGDNAPADGRSKIDVAYTVTDANGNPLANQTVTVTTDHGAQPGTVTLTTDSSGVVKVSVTNTTSGATTVTAATAGQTQPAGITFVPDTTTATITAGNLKVVTDNATADGVVTNSVKVIVTDAKGNLIPNVTVNFSATNGATVAATGTTGADGSVTQTLTSKTAGNSKVTATVNGHSQSVTLTFTADATTATLTATSGLKAGVNNAAANGTATNSVVATVTDSNGNPVPGVSVNFTADNGATIAATGTTGPDGVVTQTLTSKTAGNTQVTAGINGTTRSVTMTFTADSGTAGLDPTNNPGSSLVTTLDNQVANGTAADTVKATVTDKNGNKVAGLAVTFTVTTGATVTTTQGTTDSSGVATASVTSLKAGTYTVKATVSGSNATTPVTFMADTTTAGLDPTNNPGSSLTATNGAIANNTATNTVTATVTDKNGNPVQGVAVSFTTDAGSTVVTSPVTTNAAGVASTDVKATLAGAHTVTATVNGSNKTTTTTFIADGSTAGLDPTNNPGSSLTATSGAIANNTATNTVTATVTDKNGNPVQGVAVSFTTDVGASMVTSPVTTNAAGIASTTVTATVAGAHTVTATANGSSATTTTTFIADGSTAGLDPAGNPGSSLTATNGAIANNTATNTVTATVTDHNGNPVSGVAVSFTTDTGSTVVTSPVTTNAVGVASTTVTATVAGAHTVTATANGSSTTTTTSFIADGSTADFAGTPVVTGNNAPANGTDITGVDFTVKDASGNAVPGVSVVITTTNGAQPDTITVITDSNGVAHVDVTSTTPGVTTVTASVNGKTQTTDVTFIDPIASITVSGEVNGFPLVGTPLTATYTCVTTCPAAVSWQWRIETPRGSGSYMDIPGATTDSYTPVKGDQIRKVQAIASVQP